MKQAIFRLGHSLVVKLGLLFTVLVLVCILLSGYLVYQQSVRIILKRSKEQIGHDAQLARQSFYSLLQEVSNDIAVISHHPSVARFLEDTSNFNIGQVEALARITLANKPSYFQLRILDVGSGYEIFRFNKIENKIIKTRKQDLQYKGDKAYFINAIESQQSLYYFSEINLNEEFGKVSQPKIPTLRAVGKILDTGGQLSSLLVINVNLNGLYREFGQIMQSNSMLSLTNEAGEYIFDQEMEKCFRSQLDHAYLISDDFLMNWDTVDKGRTHSLELTQQDGVTYLAQLDVWSYSEDKHQIYLFTMMKIDDLFADAASVRNQSLKIIALISIIALGFVFAFTNVLSGSINQITQSVTAMQQGSESPELALPVHRKDEIGLLARAFSGMKQRIDEQFAALKLALAREQQAIRERDEFLQNMSHELRTPLNAILGLTELLAKNKPSRQHRPIIDSLRRSSINLSGLMHDILDQQKLSQGLIKLDMHPANLHELLQNIFTSYRFEAANKGLKLELQTAEPLKEQVFLMDALRFNQIVTNLLVNAIKYTREGRINLSARLLTESPHSLEVAITDTGQGIAADDLLRIKERFYRALDEKQTKTDGFGLGLSIVKQLVELFGGQLTVQSEVGKGSRFAVVFPLTAVASDAQGSPLLSAEVGPPRLAGSYHILHLEDDESAMMLVRSALELAGLSLRQVQTLAEAEAAAQSQTPDLMLSDLMLDHEQISRQLQTRLMRQLDCPVVILSASYPDPSSELSPYHLQKPFSLDHLLNLVVMLLGKREFDAPQLAPIYQQYDQDATKIRNYLNLLIREFTHYTKRTEQLALSRSAEDWKALRHKLITHVKSLGLPQIQPLFDKDIEMVTDDDFHLMLQQLKYCLCCFRYEAKIRSVG